MGTGLGDIYGGSSSGLDGLTTPEFGGAEIPAGSDGEGTITALPDANIPDPNELETFSEKEPDATPQEEQKSPEEESTKEQEEFSPEQKEILKEKIEEEKVSNPEYKEPINDEKKEEPATAPQQTSETNESSSENKSQDESSGPPNSTAPLPALPAQSEPEREVPEEVNTDAIISPNPGPGDAPNSSEVLQNYANETFDNESSRETFLNLAEYGLNVTRPEIIAIHEYIPLTKADLPSDSAEFNVTSLFDNNHVERSGGLKVNGVGRLIELHRQIRTYIKDSGQTVLSLLKGNKYSNNTIDIIKTSATYSNLVDENLARPTMKETVEAIIDFANDSNVSGNTNTTRGERLDKSDTYIRGIVEYYVYLAILPNIAKYIGRLAILGLNLQNNWGINKFNNIKNFSSNDLRNSTLKEVFESNTDLLENEDVYNKATGIKIAEESGDRNSSVRPNDIDTYYTLLYHLYSLINHVDSTNFLNDVYEEESFGETLLQGKNKYGLEGDLANLIKKLKSMSDVHTYVASRNNVRGSDLQDAENRIINQNLDPVPGMIFSANILGFLKNDAYYDTKIRNADRTIVSDYMVYLAEAFAVSVTDSVSKIAWNKFGITSSGNLSSPLNNTPDLTAGNATNLSLIEAYYRDIFGINIGTSTNKFRQHTFTTPNRNNIGGDYLNSLFGVSEQNSIAGTTRYIPLESGRITPNTIRTGPQFYIDPTIPQTGNQYETFANQYKEDANDIVEDIMTVYPDEEVSELLQANNSSSRDLLAAGNITNLGYAIEVFERLADDLSELTASNNGNSVPSDNWYQKMLLLMLMLSPNTGGEVNSLINSSYLGLYGSQYDNLGSNGQSLADTRGFEGTIQGMNEILVDSVLYNIVGENPRRNLSLDNAYRDEDFAGINTFISNPVGFSSPSMRQYDAVSRIFRADDPSTANIQDYTIDIKTFRLFRGPCISDINQALGPLDFEDGVRLQNITTLRPLVDSVGVQRLFYRSLLYFVKGAPALQNHGNIINDTHGNINLSMAANHYIFFTIVRNLLKQSITMYARDPQNIANNEYLAIGVEGLEGLIAGIRSAINDIRNDNSFSIPRSFTLYTDEHAFNYSKNFVLSALQKVKDRQEKVKSCLGMISGHAAALHSVIEAVKQLNISADDEVLQLMVNVLQSGDSFGGNLFEDIVKFKNTLYPAQVHANTIKYFNNRNYSLIPNNEDYLLAKTKYMSKVLSLPNYGLLEGEDLGLKSILNIGITNSLIELLKERVYATTNNQKYVDSSYITINVFKQNELNGDLLLYPRVFAFDANNYIHDYKIANFVNTLTGELSNHLNNVDSLNSLNSIIENTEYVRYNITQLNNLNITSSTNFSGNKELFTNHILDYVLKHYLELTTGLDMDPSSFPLKRSGIKYTNLVPNLTDGSLIIDDFNEIVSRLAVAYPDVFQNIELQAEAYRMTNFLKQTFPYSNTKRFERVVRPGMFDRVYSIFVNEKDFIPADNTLSFSIFGSRLIPKISGFDPNITITSKISRPLDFVGTANDSRTTEVNNYLRLLNPENPSLFSYYVQVGLLPSDAFE